jgi:hypothetical protein
MCLHKKVRQIILQSQAMYENVSQYRHKSSKNAVEAEQDAGSSSKEFQSISNKVGIELFGQRKGTELYFLD